MDGETAELGELSKMMLSNYVVDGQISLMEAMHVIDKNAKGIVYVAENLFLRGVITDGDIRRFLIKGGKLNECVSNIANRNPYSVLMGHEEEVPALMKQHCISSVPVLDDSGRIVRIYFSDDKIEQKKEKLNIPVVIMAGGKGTRLYPYTEILPKPLMPIGDQTITEHIMDSFEEYGCSEFTMIVNYKKHFIKSYFDDNENDRGVSFIEEEAFLGTGGGLSLLKDKLDKTFFLTNCDILVQEDYASILKYHRDHQNMVTMVCAEKNMVIPYGTVEMSEMGEVTAIKEKPELSFHTNTGLYVLEPEFIDMIPDQTFIHITDLIQQCIRKGCRIGAYIIGEDRWLDMGQLEELEKMKQKMGVK